jgi:hypothetical protein
LRTTYFGDNLKLGDVGASQFDEMPFWYAASNRSTVRSPPTATKPSASACSGSGNPAALPNMAGGDVFRSSMAVLEVATDGAQETSRKIPRPHPALQPWTSQPLFLHMPGDQFGHLKHADLLLAIEHGLQILVGIDEGPLFRILQPVLANERHG